MSRYSLLFLLLFAGAADADCWATTQTLLKLEVRECRVITLKSDESPDRLSTIEGVLVTGKVKEAKSVSAFDADSLVTRPPAFSEKDMAALVLPEVDSAQCSSTLRRSVDQWFVSRYRCCDTLQPRGDCIVPDPLLAADIENRPESWTVYDPPYTTGNRPPYTYED